MGHLAEFLLLVGFGNNPPLYYQRPGEKILMQLPFYQSHLTPNFGNRLG